MRDPDLWDRIRSYPFKSELPIRWLPRAVSRPLLLRRVENYEYWDRTYARQAFEEYLRFLYLAHISEDEAVPSVVIDRFWQRHMRDTWEYSEFCRATFGTFLDRPPTLRPSGDAETCPDYARIRALYAEEFGDAPPEDVWLDRTRKQVASDRAWFWIAIASAVGGGLLFWTAAKSFPGLLGYEKTVGFAAALLIFVALGPKVPGPRKKRVMHDA